MRLAGKPYEVHLLAVIFLYVLGFLVYFNSFSVPFVFDDYPNIRDNPLIRLTSIGADEISAAAFDSHAGRRPVANVSFAFNYLIGGYGVKGYHLVNIFVHIANGVLVYFLVLILLRRNPRSTEQFIESDRQLRLAAFFAAAIFIAHPVQVQAVTYIVQRMTSLATMFYLLSLLLYLLGRQRQEHRARLVYWTAALASWLLALGSKEIAATLPIIIIAVEYLFFRDPGGSRHRLHPAGLLLALAAIAAVTLLYLGTEPGAAITEQYAGRDLTPGERMLTELRVLIFYLSLLVFPIPGRLSLEHSFTISHSLIDPLTTLAAAAILLVLVLAAMRCARRHPPLTFCVIWFLVTLFIESSFIGIELAFEHRLYLPMFAFALAIAYLISLIPERRLAMGLALAGIYLLGLVAASIFRNTIWQDPARLWADAAAKNPTSYRARNNLGRVLMTQGKLAQAAQQFNDAISINPLYAEPHNNLGTLHARAGRFEIARAHFSAAIELNPGYAQAFNNLGVALLSQGRAYNATLQFAQAIRLAPDYAKAHANLSTALIHLHQLDAACRQLAMALRLDAQVPHSLETAEKCRANTKID